MSGRFCVRALLLVGLVVPFVGCGSSTSIDSIVIAPTAVTLGPGATVQLTAIGTIGHGAHPSSQQDITSQVTWASSITGVASVSPTGLVTGNNAGITSITASIKGFTGLITSNVTTITVPSPTGPLVSLAVSPDTQTASAAGQTAQFIAIGTLNTGATVNLTNKSQWTSSDSSVATINALTGLATAVGSGTATITAVSSNPDGTVVSGSAKYTVTIAGSGSGSTEPLVSMAIVPTAQTATAVGQTAQYLAIGTTASGTTVNLTNQSATVGKSVIKAAVWTSSNASTATISSTTGLATAAGAGATAITAIASNPDGSVVTAAATYTVTIPSAPEPLVSLAIVPTAQTATVANQTAQFIAIGTTATGTTVNLTNKSATVNGTTIAAAAWSSSSASTATINANTGLATALNSGVTAITAIASNPDGTVVTGTAVFTVNTSGAQEPLLSLAILPNSQSVLYPGQTSQLLAIGTFSAAPTTQNLTSNNTTFPIRWVSSDSSVASVGSPEIAGTTPGLVTATGQGTASITAYAKNTDGTLVYAAANFTVASGASEPFTAISILPGPLSLSATGQTGQFIAVGTLGDSGLAQDVTNSPQVKWTSSIPTIASVSTYPASPAGQAAGVSPGTAAITATLTNPDGTVLTATSSVTVTITAAPEPLLSIAIIPNSVTIGNLDGTAQFLAFGTFSTPPTVEDITNGINHPGFTNPTPVTWISLPAPDVFPIETGGAPGETGGLITAYGSGSEDVYAKATNPDGTVVYSTAPAVFNCPLVLASTDPQTGAITPGSCNPDTIANPLLVTLTVFNAGLNQTDWLITAASATGTPNVIHCGPAAANSGGSVCVATYPVGTPVKLTATGTDFGGWSSNCLDTAPIVENGTNSCTVTLGFDNSSNVAVGAIFNQPTN